MTKEPTRFLPEEQLVQKALEALMTALGPVEATRFLSLSREGRLESVARHHQWQKSLDRDAFFDKVFGEKGPE